MKKISYIVVFVILLCGCSNKYETVNAPNGEIYYKVKCSKESSICLSEASKSCNNEKYNVISSESHAGGVFADIFPGPITWYSITYKCGEGNNKLPDFKFTGQSYVPPPVIITPPTTQVIKPEPFTPAPLPTMKTTTCNKIGDTLNCTSY